MEIHNNSSQSKIEVLEGCTDLTRRQWSEQEPLIPPGEYMNITDLQPCTYIEIDQNPGQNWYIKIVNPCDYEFITSGETIITGIGFVNLPGEDPYLRINFKPTEPNWKLKINNPAESYSGAQPSNVTIGDD